MKTHIEDLIFGTTFSMILVVSVWFMYQVSNAPILEVISK